LRSRFPIINSTQMTRGVDMMRVSRLCAFGVCEEISIFQSVAARFPLTRERLSCIFLPAERLRGFVKASGRKSGKRKRRRDFLLGLTEGQGREYKRRLTGEMMNFTFDFKENNLSALCSWPLACLFFGRRWLQFSCLARLAGGNFKETKMSSR
jgi:hypothetical protein